MQQIPAGAPLGEVLSIARNNFADIAPRLNALERGLPQIGLYAPAPGGPVYPRSLKGSAWSTCTRRGAIMGSSASTQLIRGLVPMSPVGVFPMLVVGYRSSEYVLYRVDADGSVATLGTCAISNSYYVVGAVATGPNRMKVVEYYRVLGSTITRLHAFDLIWDGTSLTKSAEVQGPQYVSAGSTTSHNCRITISDGRVFAHANVVDGGLHIRELNQESGGLFGMLGSVSSAGNAYTHDHLTADRAVFLHHGYTSLGAYSLFVSTVEKTSRGFKVLDSQMLEAGSKNDLYIYALNAGLVVVHWYTGTNYRMLLLGVDANGGLTILSPVFTTGVLSTSWGGGVPQDATRLLIPVQSSTAADAARVVSIDPVAGTYADTPVAGALFRGAAGSVYDMVHLGPNRVLVSGREGTGSFFGVEVWDLS